jgi:hypothetical protein
VPRVIPASDIEDGFAKARTIVPGREAVVTGIDPASIPASLINENDSAELGSLDLVKYSSDELLLNTHTPADRFLVFSDVYFPGWRAWVDGKEVPVYRTDGVVKGVIVPSGDHSIHFKYDPISYRIGWMIAICALVLCAVLFRPVRNLLHNAVDRSRLG